MEPVLLRVCTPLSGFGEAIVLLQPATAAAEAVLVAVEAVVVAALLLAYFLECLHISRNFNLRLSLLTRYRARVVVSLPIDMKREG